MPQANGKPPPVCGSAVFVKLPPKLAAAPAGHTMIF